MGILYTIATQNKQDLSLVCRLCGIYESSKRSQCAGCKIEQRRQLEVTQKQKEKLHTVRVHSKGD